MDVRTDGPIPIIKALLLSIDNPFSSMASKPINIRWIDTGSKQYEKKYIAYFIGLKLA